MRPFNYCTLLFAYYLTNYHNGTQCWVTFYLEFVFGQKFCGTIFLLQHCCNASFKGLHRLQK